MSLLNQLILGQYHRDMDSRTAANPLQGCLGEAWQMYRAHARYLLVLAFCIYIGAAVLAALLGLAGNVGAFLGWIASMFAGFLLQATLIKAVQDEREGRREMTIADTVNAAMPYLGAVAIASIVASIAFAIGWILLIVPGLWLMTIWAVIIPVIVIERAGAFESFGRSQDLVRGRGWHVFFTLVLLWVIQFVVGLVLDVIFSALPGSFRDGLSTVIAGTLIAPFAAIVVTLIYYRLADGGAATWGSTTDSSDTPDL
jgi:hypothetical protein